MKFTKILVIGIAEEQLDASSWRVIRSLTGNCVILPADSPDIDAHLRNTDCLLVYTKADKAMMHKAPHLKYIGTLSMGLKNADIAYALSKKIVVTKVPEYNTETRSISDEAKTIEQVTFVGNMQNFLQGKPTNKVKPTSKH